MANMRISDLFAASALMSDAENEALIFTLIKQKRYSAVCCICRHYFPKDVLIYAYDCGGMDAVVSLEDCLARRFEERGQYSVTDMIIHVIKKRDDDGVATIVARYGDKYITFVMWMMRGNVEDLCYFMEHSWICKILREKCGIYVADTQNKEVFAETYAKGCILTSIVITTAIKNNSLSFLKWMRTVTTNDDWVNVDISKVGNICEKRDVYEMVSFLTSDGIIIDGRYDYHRYMLHSGNVDAFDVLVEMKVPRNVVDTETLYNQAHRIIIRSINYGIPHNIPVTSLKEMIDNGMLPHLPSFDQLYYEQSKNNKKHDTVDVAEEYRRWMRVMKIVDAYADIVIV
jgi:hypothetical protein